MTPGPWQMRVAFQGQHHVDGFIGGPGGDVAEIRRVSPEDAAVILAAPELLEAGNDLVDAVLSIAPSTMYPAIIRDALNAWIAARARMGAKESA